MEYGFKMLNYTIEHQCDNDSSQAVMEGLRNFNAAFIGTVKPRQLAIIIRNDEGQNRRWSSRRNQM